MKYFILILLICTQSIISNIAYCYDGSTKAAVTIAGGIIKAQHTENTKKFKRKNCPVCKGKGWYMSGDDITKVICGYCEPEEVTHPPVIITGPSLPKCNGPQCNQKSSSILKR